MTGAGGDISWIVPSMQATTKDIMDSGLLNNVDPIIVDVKYLSEIVQEVDGTVDGTTNGTTNGTVDGDPNEVGTDPTGADRSIGGGNDGEVWPWALAAALVVAIAGFFVIRAARRNRREPADLRQYVQHEDDDRESHMEGGEKSVASNSLYVGSANEYAANASSDDDIVFEDDGSPASQRSTGRRPVI